MAPQNDRAQDLEIHQISMTRLTQGRIVLRLLQRLIISSHKYLKGDSFA